jgi:tripartite-type tricarboxylate transporter receptor subunit TctC
LACNDFADDFPSKPIRIIVPSLVGNSSDINTRKVAAMVSERLKQRLIVDNRPGAGGNIGTAIAANSTPDGYTLAFVWNATMAVNPHIYPSTGYDPLKDFAPIIISYEGQAFLVVSAGSAIRSVADLIKAAKRAPGRCAMRRAVSVRHHTS